MNLLRVCLFCRTIVHLPPVIDASDPLILDKLACCDEACFTARRSHLADRLRWDLSWMGR